MSRQGGGGMCKNKGSGAPDSITSSVVVTVLLSYLSKAGRMKKQPPNWRRSKKNSNDQTTNPISWGELVCPKFERVCGSDGGGTSSVVRCRLHRVWSTSGWNRGAAPAPSGLSRGRRRLPTAGHACRRHSNLAGQPVQQPDGLNGCPQGWYFVGECLFRIRFCP